MTPLSGETIGLAITGTVAVWIVSIAALVAWTLRSGERKRRGRQ